ncbi:MAG: hypothetical protein A2V98_22545 [Planctomycetes bacterium RBG_16_64_12]|nr:MAG: hypothetical protein A2V98_22545 [Planctomycetes bacterium RBG_16_64_12]
MAGNLAVTAGCAAAMWLGAASGCSKLDLRKGLSWPGSDPKPRTPARMVDVWTDAVLQGPGEPGVRGFGGRIMFYADQKEDPVVVDGTLTVYTFDDDDPGPDNTGPKKKYLFLPEQLPNHYSKSKVGHSYSFWIPWDAVGGPERRISLIARFEDREGKVVMSKVAHTTLPGRRAATDAQDECAGTDQPSVGARRLDHPTPGGVRQVAHEVPVQPPAKQEKMTTATIHVTPSFTRKLLAAPDRAADTRSAWQIDPMNRVTTSDGDAGGQPGSVRLAATADPQAERQAGANDPAGEPAPSGHSGPPTLRVPREAAGEPTYAPARRQLPPARRPSPLPRTPRSNRFPSPSATTPADPSTLD